MAPGLQTLILNRRAPRLLREGAGGRQVHGSQRTWPLGLAPFFEPVCRLCPGGRRALLRQEVGCLGRRGWRPGFWEMLQGSPKRQESFPSKLLVWWGQMQPQLTPAPCVPCPRSTHITIASLGHRTPGAEGTVNSLLGAQALSQHEGHCPQQQQHVGLLGGVLRTSHGDPHCPPASGSQLQSAGASWLARTGAGSSPSRWSG